MTINLKRVLRIIQQPYYSLEKEELKMLRSNRLEGRRFLMLEQMGSSSHGMDKTWAEHGLLNHSYRRIGRVYSCSYFQENYFPHAHLTPNLYSLSLLLISGWFYFLFAWKNISFHLKICIPSCLISFLLCFLLFYFPLERILLDPPCPIDTVAWSFL